MNTTTFPDRRRHTPDVFFPIVLIGAGIILLMSNMGLITQNPFPLLFQFWPILLIAAGIQILFSRTGVIGTIVSAVLGLAVVAGAVLYLTLPGERTAPAWFGWNWSWFPQSAALRTESIAKPLESTDTATADLNFPGGRGSIKPVNDAANLMEGDLTYPGELITDVKRSDDIATVLVDSRFRNDGFDLISGQQRWDIRLNPRIPFALKLDVGSGTHEFDLREFHLTGITLGQGSGDTTFRLPDKGQYPFKLEMGSGSINVVLPKGLPARVNYDIGSGSLNVNNTYHDNGFGKRGTYETPGFTQDGSHVIFDIEIGSGNITIR